MIAAHAPVDLAKTVEQAQQALARGDIVTAQTLIASIQKQNYMAPIEMRPGATAADPLNPRHILAVAPQNIEGANPEIGPDGQWTGRYTQAPGAAGAIETAAAAKATGGAAADLVQTVDPKTGQSRYVPKTSLLGGGAPTPANGSGGGLNGLFGGGQGGGAPSNVSGLAPGAAAALADTGKHSAAAFQAISDRASQSRDAINALNNINQIASGPTQFGPGSESATRFAGIVNGLGKAVGFQPNFNAANITNINEFNKWAAQYSARTAAALGLTGSDARMNLTIHATPNGEMTNDAIRSVVPAMVGMERSVLGMDAAKAQWLQSHTPDTSQQFQTQWNKNYDPRIYQWMAAGPQVLRNNLAKLPPADRAALIAKSNALSQMGAFVQ
jgi:hypothetical protein